MNTIFEALFKSIAPWRKSKKMHVLFVLLYCVLGYSQQSIKNLHPSLWVKPTSKETAASSQETRPGKLGARYFNFNPTIDFSDEKILTRYPRLISKTSSLFLVFKSNENNGVNLIQLQNAKKKVYIGNTKITTVNDVTYHKGNPEKGMLLTYIFSKNNLPGQRKGTLLFEEALTQDHETKNSLAELIYIPEVVGDDQKNVIESYLSVKYGISLQSNNHYFDSRHQKIWDYKTAEGYNNRVTGLGRDDGSGLYQKQSGNVEKDGLFWSVGPLAYSNAANKSIFGDGSFWIWADNGKSTTIEEENSMAPIQKMQRIWKMKITAKDSLRPLVQPIINTKEMNLGLSPKGNTQDKEIWLAVDGSGSAAFNYVTATYVKTKKIVQDSLYFNPVAFKPGSAQFTFVQAPDFFLTGNYTSSGCDSSAPGRLKIRMHGGVAPYTITLKGTNYHQSISVSKDTIEIFLNAIGSLVVDCTDNTGIKCSENLALDGFGAENKVSLKPQWLLENHQVIISPQTNLVEDTNQYEWYKQDMLIQSGKFLTASEPGRYKLLITNSKGCEKTLPFSVLDTKTSENNDWSLYPNPVTSGMPFSIVLPFREASRVTISIFDLNGRLIRFRDLGLITDYRYQDRLELPGIYMIVCSINGEQLATKLIVK